MSFSSKLSNLKEALAASGSDAEPRSGSRSLAWGFSRGSERVERVRVDRQQYQRLWDAYHGTPLIKSAVGMYASDVASDGWRIVADSEETRDGLSEWCESCAVVGGERDVNISELVKQVVTSHSVQGVALCEKAPARGSNNSVAGLIMIDPSTITVQKSPRSDTLVHPDDTELDDVRLTDKGTAACYIQHIDTPDERRFDENDVLQLSNSPQPGDIFGSSDVTPVLDRIEALKGILADNDEAIAKTARRRLVWQLGPREETGFDGNTEYEYYDESDVSDFADQMGDLSAGDSVSVSGDIDITDLPTDFPESDEYLDYVTRYILSAFPIPNYVMGWSVNQPPHMAERIERARERAVNEIRGRIEDMLTEVLREVADQRGLDPAGVGLKLSADTSDQPLADLSVDDVNKIERYARAIDTISGGRGPASVVDSDALLEKVLRLDPDDAADIDDGDFPPIDPADPLDGIDELNTEVREQFADSDD